MQIPSEKIKEMIQTRITALRQEAKQYNEEADAENSISWHLAREDKSAAHELEMILSFINGYEGVQPPE